MDIQKQISILPHIWILRDNPELLQMQADNIYLQDRDHSLADQDLFDKFQVHMVSEWTIKNCKIKFRIKFILGTPDKTYFLPAVNKFLINSRW